MLSYYATLYQNRKSYFIPYKNPFRADLIGVVSDHRAIPRRKMMPQIRPDKASLGEESIHLRIWLCSRRPEVFPCYIGSFDTRALSF